MQLQKSNSTDFKPIEEGKYDAILHCIIGVGIQKRPPYQGKPRSPAPALRFVFEIPSIKYEDGKTTVIGKKVTASTSERGALFKVLNGLLGSMTENKLQEVMTGDLDKLIGTAVSLTVEHWTPPGKEEAIHVINEIFPLDSRIIPPKAEREGYVFHFDNPDLDTFKKISKYTQKEILKAEDADTLPKEFSAIVNDEAASIAQINKELDDELTF